MESSNEPQGQRPMTEIQHMCIQMLAMLIFAGIFLQLKHLNDNSLDYEIYNAVLFIIGILIMLYCFIKQDEGRIRGSQGEECKYLTVQKHHYFIIFMSGILASLKTICHILYLFFDFNFDISLECKDNEVICGITQVIFLLGIYLHILFFYKMDGTKVPANASFNGIFIFLFVVNLIGYMTTFISQLSFDTSNCYKGDYHTYLHDTPNNVKMNCANGIITFRGILLNGSMQYFLVSAYVMLSLYWQLNQNPGLHNIHEIYSMGDLMKRLKQWCTCRRRAESIQAEDVEQPRTSLSDIIPFLRIFQLRSANIFGFLLGLIIFTLQITIDIYLAKIPTSNSTINNSNTNYGSNISNINISNLTNISHTRWHYIYISINLVDEVLMTIFVVLAYKTFCSMKQLFFVKFSKPLETRGDRFFIIISHCGNIFQILLGLLQIGKHYDYDFKNLLNVIYGFDDTIVIIHAAFQTHFILLSLDWTPDLNTVSDPRTEQIKQDMSIKLQKRAIICGILNMFASAVYLYEVQQNYFNIETSDQSDYRIVSLFTRPLQIFYSCFSFIYMFKLAVNFSYTNQSNCQDLEDDELLLHQHENTSRKSEENYGSSVNEKTLLIHKHRKE